jgi:hypothetical protein
MRCHQCGGTGEVELAVYRELDRMWNAGWGWVMDSSFLSDFWAERGYNPDNPPARYSVCNACGGTGGTPDVYENLALEARALAAWRAANPEGLIGRLLALHQRNRELAHTLARYAEQYYGLDGELTADVAAWPVPAHGPCPSCFGSGRWGDVIPLGLGDTESPKE